MRQDPLRTIEEGLRYQKLGMLDRALEQYRATADSSSDPEVLSQAYLRESHVYRAWCRWDHAIAAAQRSARLARANDLHHAYGDALNAEAIVHQERGDFERARELYEQMLKLPLDERTRGLAYQNLGSICAQRADFAAAEHHFRRSYGCFQKAGYRWGEAFALNNYAAVYLDEGKLKRAAVVAGQAMVAARKVGDLELLGIATLNAAEALAAQGEIARAESLATSALEYFSLEENDLRRAQCYRVLGDILVMRGRKGDAQRNYKQALGLAQSVGSEREEARIRDCMELAQNG